MIRKLILSLSLLLAIGESPASAAVRVVATTPEYAALTAAIGGGRPGGGLAPPPPGGGEDPAHPFGLAWPLARIRGHQIARCPRAPRPPKGEHLCRRHPPLHDGPGKGGGGGPPHRRRSLRSRY